MVRRPLGIALGLVALLAPAKARAAGRRGGRDRHGHASRRDGRLRARRQGRAAPPLLVRQPGSGAARRPWRLRASRGRHGPPAQHRHPRRQLRSQQEGHADGGRRPHRTRAVLRARGVLLPAHRSHEHGARREGPVVDPLRPADGRRRDRPGDARDPHGAQGHLRPRARSVRLQQAARHVRHERRARAASSSRACGSTTPGSRTSTAAATPASRATSGWRRPPTTPTRAPRCRTNSCSSSATPTSSRTRRTSASPTPTSTPRPIAATSRARDDKMDNHRTSIELTHKLRFSPDIDVTTTAYRHDFARIWRKVNGIRGADISDVLAHPETPRNAVYRGTLTGEVDTQDASQAILIGPNNRKFVSQGVQMQARVAGKTGPIEHHVDVRRARAQRRDRPPAHAGRLLSMTLQASSSPTGASPRSPPTTRRRRIALAMWAVDAMTFGPVTLTPGRSHRGHPRGLSRQPARACTTARRTAR